MLLKIKEKVTGWLAYLIIGLISVPFALWGINFYFQDGGDDTIIQVGDYEIGMQYFSQLLYYQKRSMEDRGLDIPVDRIKQEVIVSILRSRLLAQELDDYHYVVPDVALAENISQNERFQVDGVFNRAAYLKFLQSSNYTQQSYEDELKDNLRFQQFETAIRDSSFLTVDERRLYEDFFHQERDVNYIALPVEKFIDPDSVPEDRAERHYENNLTAYQTQLRGKFEYIEFNIEDIYPEIIIEDSELRDYYENNRENIAGLETRTAAHILFDPNRYDSEIEMQELIANVYQQLQAGKDFGDMAAEYSDDSLTARDGGRLEPLTRSSIDEPLIEEAIFSLQVGEFSDPISSRFGTQIFYLLETDTSVTQTFEEHRDIVDAALRHEKASALYADRFVDINTVAFEDIFSLQPVAEKFGLEIKRTEDWVTERASQGIFSNPGVKQIAFADRVIFNDRNSKLTEYEEGRAVVLRSFANELPRQQTYEEVKEDILTQLRLQEANKVARKAVQEILLELTTGSSLESFASQYEVAVQQLGFIRRHTSDIDTGLVKIAYSIKEPAPGAEIANKHNMGILSDGSYALVEVNEIRQGEPELDTPDFSLFPNELNIFLQNLTNTIPIFIDHESIAQLEKT